MSKLHALFRASDKAVRRNAGMFPWGWVVAGIAITLFLVEELDKWTVAR
jgi:hypothetical protein